MHPEYSAQRPDKATTILPDGRPMPMPEWTREDRRRPCAPARRPAIGDYITPPGDRAPRPVAPVGAPLGLSYSHNLTNRPIEAAAYVDYAPDGSYIKLGFHNLTTGRQREGAIKARAAGRLLDNREAMLQGPTPDGRRLLGPMPKRGRVHGFTRSSQHRLRVLTNSLPSSLPLPLFITLTYPAWWPDNPEQWKSDLHTMTTAISRELDKPTIIWKLEPQERGAPHFHLAVYSEAFLPKRWLSRRWYKVVGSRDRRHLRAGTKIERARSRRGALSYIAKYLEKTVSPRLGWEAVGRYWGVWNRPKGMLKRVHVPQRSAYKIRRVLWNYRASNGRGRKRTPYRGDAQGASGYLGGDQAARLLAYGLGNSYVNTPGDKPPEVWPYTLPPYPAMLAAVIETPGVNNSAVLMSSSLGPFLGGLAGGA